jgi:hypothetical protein
MLTGNRNLPRGSRRQNSGWKRRCDVRSGYQTTSQEFPTKDERVGDRHGAAFWVFETIESLRRTVQSTSSHLLYAMYTVL